MTDDLEKKLREIRDFQTSAKTKSEKDRLEKEIQLITECKNSLDHLVAESRQKTGQPFEINKEPASNKFKQYADKIADIAICAGVTAGITYLLYKFGQNYPLGCFDSTQPANAMKTQGLANPDAFMFPDLLIRSGIFAYLNSIAAGTVIETKNQMLSLPNATKPYSESVQRSLGSSAISIIPVVVAGIVSYYTFGSQGYLAGVASLAFASLYPAIKAYRKMSV